VLFAFGIKSSSPFRRAGIAAVQWPFEYAQIDTTAGVTLVVLWKQGSLVVARQVPVAREVADFLREAMDRTIQEAGERQARPYYPEMHLEKEECLVLQDPSLFEDTGIGGLLFPDQPHSQIRPDELENRVLWMYASIVGSVERRRAFIRRGNAHVDARRGRLFTTLTNSLARIEEPILALNDRFDLIAGMSGVIALNQPTFDAVFKEAPALVEHIDAWVTGISQTLPFSGDGAERLARLSASDLRVRRILRTIHERGHLQTVRIDQVRQYCQEAGIDGSLYIENEMLRVDAGEVFRLLHLLNEDYFRGGLTDAPFMSERKSPQNAQ